MHSTNIHLAQLSNTALQTAAPSATAPSPRLVAAAHEFEAQMMKELLKPLSSSGLKADDGDSSEDGDDDTGAGGAMAAYATEAFGNALSSRGGFGVATGIIASLSHPKTQVTAAGNGNTGLQPLK